MAISFRNSIGVYESALKLRAARAEILAGNLANADTPGYQAKDFNFAEALKHQMASTPSGNELALTQPLHQEGMEGLGGGMDVQFRTPTQPSLDGNTVEEQVEHAEFMQNSLEYQTSFTLLNSRFRGLMSAIKGE
ncbi:MAG TPA: flagellar basal body rod protein FlgB [Cellvibrionaceae bacterium]|nr:flagellar basal body rod protein FlgB [Cellvibrionaceae bacterium]